MSYNGLETFWSYTATNEIERFDRNGIVRNVCFTELMMMQLDFSTYMYRIMQTLETKACSEAD